jgi:hypothetical protein
MNAGQLYLQLSPRNRKSHLLEFGSMTGNKDQMLNRELPRWLGKVIRYKGDQDLPRMMQCIWREKQQI